VEPAPSVEVENLRRTFKVPVRSGGLRASLRALVHRQFRQVVAVEGATFRLEPGEVVGFLGPNGAGKTTTLKMLSGLLHPDSGRASVLGFEPKRRPRELLRRIGLVTGNRTSLAWDLPALDSYLMLRALYEIPKPDFENRRDRFIETLDLGELVTKPVRNLSLGERMKVELVGALLHAPAVLFLDEPTLGLDVSMQRRLRRFISDYNTEFGATVLLTSHYMADVEALCKRVMVIHRGRIHHDGELSGLVARFATHKTESQRLAEYDPAKPTDSSFYKDDRNIGLWAQKRAQQLGFSLKEIRELLSLGNQSCDATRKIAERRLADIEARLTDLKAMRGMLARLIRACATGRDAACPIVQSLSGVHDSS